MSISIRIIFVISVFCTSLSFSFCQDYIMPVPLESEQENGLYKSVYPNGKLLSTYYVKDGFIDSVYKEYYKYGLLKVEGYYKKGLLNGCRKTYRRNGTLKWETYYKDGLLNGKAVKYRKNGIKKLEVNYKDGFLHGYDIFFNKRELMTYQGENDMGKSKKEWKSCYYYSNDSLKKSYYRFGLFKMADSTYYEYHPNGKLKIIGNYSNHKKDGEWLYYDSYGNIIEKVYFIEGKKQKH